MAELSTAEKWAIFIWYSLFAFGSGVWLMVATPPEWEFPVAVLVSAGLIFLATYVRLLVRKVKAG